MKIIAVVPLLILCVACAQTQKPVMISATGFSHMNAQAPGGADYRTALKNAELGARQELQNHLNMYRVANDLPLEQLYTIDPFVHAVCDDTVRSARISDRTVKEDGAVSVKVELDLSLLSWMLGESVTPPAVAQQAQTAQTPAAK